MLGATSPVYGQREAEESEYMDMYEERDMYLGEKGRNDREEAGANAGAGNVGFSLPGVKKDKSVFGRRPQSHNGSGSYGSSDMEDSTDPPTLPSYPDTPIDTQLLLIILGGLTLAGVKLRKA